MKDTTWKWILGTTVLIWAMEKFSASGKTPATTAPGRAPVFMPASYTQPAGQNLHLAANGATYWLYQDANGYAHYVSGLTDIVQLAPGYFRVMHRQSRVTEDIQDSLESLLLTGVRFFEH